MRDAVRYLDIPGVPPAACRETLWRENRRGATVGILGPHAALCTVLSFPALVPSPPPNAKLKQNPPHHSNYTTPHNKTQTRGRHRPQLRAARTRIGPVGDSDYKPPTIKRGLGYVGAQQHNPAAKPNTSNRKQTWRPAPPSTLPSASSAKHLK